MFLLALGLVLTVAWLWAGWYYLTVYFGQENIFYLLPAELGLFLVGFFAPLGVFWLMVAQSSVRRRLIRLERQIAALAAGPEELLPSEPGLEEPTFGEAGDGGRGDPGEAPRGGGEVFDRSASGSARQEPRFDSATDETLVEEDLTADPGRSAEASRQPGGKGEAGRGDTAQDGAGPGGGKKH